MKELFKKLGATKFDEKSIKDKSEVLAVTISKKPSEEEVEKATAQSSSQSRRPVIIDGVLMELPEGVIIGMVRLGVFKVVWPGTKEQVWFGESSGGYPPIYIEPHLPHRPDRKP